MEIEILTSLIWSPHAVHNTELTYSISHICAIERKNFKLNSTPYMYLSLTLQHTHTQPAQHLSVGTGC